MGSSSRPAGSVQTSVRQEYPAFFQPYLEQVLKGAEEQYQTPYLPFPEARLVETPAARTEALTALQAPELTQFSQPMFDTALTGTAEAAKTFPETDLESYMNPYRQHVTEQLLSKAGERRGIERKKISDAAARAGAFGGGRHGITEGLFDEGTQEQLQDIQERSDMANFQNALAASQADKTRGLQAALQTSQLGEAQRNALIAGQVGREKAATAEEALAQRIRDVGFSEFQEQTRDPQQKLAEYSAIIRGHTPPANQWQTKDIQQAYSPLQAGIGTAGMLGGLAKGFGMMSSQGGSIPFNRGGGLSSVLNFQDQGPVQVASLSTPQQERAEDVQAKDAYWRGWDQDQGQKSWDYQQEALDKKRLKIMQSMNELLKLQDSPQDDIVTKALELSRQMGERLDESKPKTTKDIVNDAVKKLSGYGTRGVHALEGPEARPVDKTTNVDISETVKELMKNKGGPVRFNGGGGMTGIGGDTGEEDVFLGEGYQGFEGFGDTNNVTQAVPDDPTFGGWRGTPVDMSNVGQHGPASQYGPEGPEIPTNMAKFTHQPSGLEQIADWIRGRKRSRTTPLYDTRMALDMGEGKREHHPSVAGFQTPRQNRLNEEISPQGYVTNRGNTAEVRERLLQNRESDRLEQKLGYNPDTHEIDRNSLSMSYGLPVKKNRFYREGSSVRMAYGGVPGQAYTEDIGMVGGLGAVAGPQMRFAYGGVPGQPYTEDIGMTGGLAAVAGPQLRFQVGMGVGTPGIFGEEDRKKVLATPEYQAFAKQRGEGRSAWRQMLPEGWDPYNTQQILLRDFMDIKRRRKGQEVSAAQGERWDALMGSGPDALQKAKAASQRLTDVSKKRMMDFPRELIIDTSEVVKGDNGELHEYDQEDFDVGESGIMPSRTKEKPKPKPQDKPKEKVSTSPKATDDKDEMGWRDLLSWGTPLAFQNQYGNVAGQNIARGGGKRLSGTEKEAVQSLVDLRKAQEKDIAAKRSGATLKEVIATQKDSRDWQHKVMTLYSNLESGNMDRAQKMFTGMDKMQQMALMGILELDEDDREKALMDSGMQIEAIKKLTKQLQGENPLIKFLGGMGNRSTLDSASGGSIPESFKKLGISNIRKV